MRIGVRLGSSGAYGALVDNDSARTAASVPLTADWTEPLTTLLRDLAATAPSPVTSVTWDISAMLEETLAPAAGAALRAQPVAAIRVVPRAPSAPDGGGHPSALVRSLIGWRGTVPGGHDLFGTELCELDLDAARRCAEAAEAAGLTTLAITATGAAACPDHEVAVAAELLERFPHVRLCLSHETGGLGLLEREATTAVNAALLDVAEGIIAGCEHATGTLAGKPSCWFATGDGGRVSGKRLCWLPIVGLSATPAAALIGAARLSETTDALVVLTSASTITMGQVRDGLPHVEADLSGNSGVRMAPPQPVLTVSPTPAVSAAPLLAAHSRHTADVVAVLDEDGSETADQFRHATDSDPLLVRPNADIAAVGAACTEPSAWLDLLVPLDTQGSLERIQTEAEQRALALVAAHGAGPGSEYIVRSAATAVGYLRIYRLQVRAGSRTEPGPAR
ncbi:hypothetical protein [Streptomyces gobiensis]|uniref:hypothetical protein n=1 Tax=Streptomyces gobiensis TaxID=2875706 RepID=UPI001E3FAD1F|nr:hypothetical protein [Streptomyces gobiensis]UGY94574.1 hypothetical protein test1122_24475 [Streptomyces gobiensis]